MDACDQGAAERCPAGPEPFFPTGDYPQGGAAKASQREVWARLNLAVPAVTRLACRLEFRALARELWHRINWRRPEDLDDEVLQASIALATEWLRALSCQAEELSRLRREIEAAASEIERRELRTAYWLKNCPVRLTGRVRRRLEQHPPSFEACREAERRAHYRLEQRLEILVAFMATSPSARREPGRAALSELAVALLLQPGRWSLRAAACRALAAAGPPAEGAVRALSEVAKRPREFAFLRAAALGALPGLDPASALALLREQRADPDAVLRRACLPVLTELGDRGHALLLEVLEADPSEAVRQKALQLVLESKRPIPDGLLQRICRSASPRVRAVWATCLLQHGAGEGAGLTAPRCLDLAALHLPCEGDLEIARVCLRALAEFLLLLEPEARTPELEDALQRLSVSLRARAQKAPLDLSLHSWWWLCDELAFVLRDPASSTWLVRLRAALGSLSEGQRRIFRVSEWPDDPEIERRVLGCLAALDHGLFVRRRRGAITVQRGARRSLRLWRLLHELRHPSFDKRQAHPHLTGTKLFGEHWYPSLVMAEVTRTRVPGEAFLHTNFGHSVPQLPGPTQAIEIGAGRRAIAVHLPGASLRLTPRQAPALLRWLRPLRLAFCFRGLDEMRFAALKDGSREAVQRYLARYLDCAGQSLGLESPDGRWEDFLGIGREDQRNEPWAAPALVPGLEELGRYLVEPSTNLPADLGLFVGAAFALLLGRRALHAVEVRRLRARIPLCIGGWGSRGKSGTERLKVALFHGLGFQVFSKTTGTDPTFISSLPGLDPTEVQVYRPYQKSTIWEQMALVRQAVGMGAQVFLWEAMALNPRLIQVLQRDWMQNDLATITNTYPDHEDIQGPTGHDVAWTISSFVPRRSVLLTSEQQMLPILREVAARQQTELGAVSPVCAALLPDELLRRFPYLEHPLNIALIQELARKLQVDPDLALCLMAENIVADIGGLKIYKPLLVDGRAIDFTNTMSANERAGFLASLQRLGFDALDPCNRMSEPLILMVNNRVDRPARSEVFSRVVVEDTSPNAVLVVGTAVNQFRRQLEAVYDEYCRRRARPAGPDRESYQRWLGLLFRPVRFDPCRGGDWPELLGRWLKVDPTALQTELRGPMQSLRERLAQRVGSWDPAQLEALQAELSREIAAELRAQANAQNPIPSTRDTAGAASGGWSRSELSPLGAASDTAAFAARELVLAAIGQHLTDDWTEANAEALSQEAHSLSRTMFAAQIEVVEDVAVTAEELIARAARRCPPGAHGHMVGLQNIKGPGMETVRAFAALEAVEDRLRALEDPLGRERTLEWLEAHAPWRPHEVSLAVRTLEARPALSPEERALLEQLRAEQAPRPAERRQSGLPLRALLRGIQEVFAGVRRRRQADRIQALLRDGLLSHGEAALRLQELSRQQDLATSVSA